MVVERSGGCSIRQKHLLAEPRITQLTRSMKQEMIEEDQATNSEVEASEVEGVESLKRALAEAKAKAETNRAGWQMAQADLINYRRRSERENEEVSKFANSAIVDAMLPVLDDLELSFTYLPRELAEVMWVDGVRLVERKLKATLEAQGLSEIKALGEPFDPRLHEAVMIARGEEGMVVLELQKGYKFRDRVIRPSKVAVGSGEEVGKAEEKKEA